MESAKARREFLKANPRRVWDNLQSDQRKGVPSPPVQKPVPPEAILVDLVPPGELTSGQVPLMELLAKRRSRRKFTDNPLSLEELSFLLWSCQGLSMSNPRRRTAPSAGARHPFETYIYLRNVIDVPPGVYRYLPVDHKLVFLHNSPGLPEVLTKACFDQKFVGEAAAVFIWTVLPYRTEWRYDVISHKPIAMDAGHVCQNLYLAAEAINGGTCAIGAYDQLEMDRILGVDGEEEFTIYVAPVGKIG